MSFRLSLLVLLGFVASLRAGPVVLDSPGGTLRGTIATDHAGALVFSVELANRTVIAASRIGVTLDGRDLGANVTLGAPVFGAVDETYPMIGGHATAVNRARTLTLPVTTLAGPAGVRLEARAYDDGFAWRLVVPGDNAVTRRVQGEASFWSLPARSRVWYFERNSDWKLKSYAGEWVAAPMESLATVSPQGPVQGAPLVAELAGGGYALITEAALINYSGLRLRALPNRSSVQADFTEGSAGFEVTGEIVTPWRVTLVAVDLDRLVNSTLISNLCPPPDARLYADTSYIKPGRAVWRWWSSGTGTSAEERAFVDDAVALGFEYTLVDDGWKNWPQAWEEVRDIAGYARERGVGVLIWKEYKEVSAPADDWMPLRAFLDAAAAAGVAGVKIDFLNAESKDRVDFITAALRLAAARRLLVLFHGVAKSTGEERTFPNQLSREAIRGLELNKMKEGPIPASHNAALPFTRFVVGPADYTPLGYSRPGPTTWAHQLATVVQFTSPLQVIAENPDFLLHDAKAQLALDVLRAIPATWDETRVLPPSAIGVLSIIARRKGDTWFLAIVNGDAPVRLDRVSLSFLGPGGYHAVELTSPARSGFVRRELKGANAASTLTFDLGAGDGAVVQCTLAPLDEIQVRGGLPNFAAKAAAGGTVRVAYLGGSITAANGWRVLSRELLQRIYPKAKLEEIFAAVSGTGSPLGVARFQRDVLAHQPDLLFVEFAVNDGALNPQRIEKAMEGIVRKLWREYPSADICFVYTLSRPMLADYSKGQLNRSARTMERVAVRYGIPSITFGFEVSRQIEAGKMVFQAGKELGVKDAQGRTIFSNDGTHPITAGHALYTSVIERAWPALTARGVVGLHQLGAPLQEGNWERATIHPVDALKASGEWREIPPNDPRLTIHAGKIAPRTWRSDKAGNTVEGVVHGSVIGAVGYKNEKSSFFRVYVDDLPPVEGSFRDEPMVAQYRLKSWFDLRTHSPGSHRVRIEQISGSDTGMELFLSGLLSSGD